MVSSSISELCKTPVVLEVRTAAMLDLLTGGVWKYEVF